ncbi:hypothetical protein [Ruegeria pomeroyi]|uniref:Uncharacterized protein n=1 Tax=Ruegeria pomeroyi TaxID=89184 RepID=A0A850LMF1_9RHOB|nr:hypothetical protein [Ruegeria pomeroyi]NVK98869.1 hypothetical protein [Ruegeria pomeroyi]
MQAKTKTRAVESQPKHQNRNDCNDNRGGDAENIQCHGVGKTIIDRSPRCWSEQQRDGDKDRGRGKVTSMG